MGSLSVQCGEREFDLWDLNAYDPAVRKQVESRQETVIELDADLKSASSIYGFAIRRGQETIAQGYSFASAGPSLVHDRSAVCVDSHVFYAQGDQVACIDVETGRLVWHVEADDATCFDLYALSQPRALIVHGELTICRLGLDGEIAWQVSGADIFTGPFQVHGDVVIAIDFNEEKYTIRIADGHLMTASDLHG